MSVQIDLSGQVALVTGSRRGLGKAIAMRLAEAGADIVINDIVPGQEEADATAAEIRAMGRRAIAVCGDVSKSEDANNLIEQAWKEMGKIDILVNNAGITRDNLLIRMTDDEWQSVININLTGTFFCTRAISKRMMKARYGRIINIASVIGLMGNAGQTNYAASKAGIIGMTKANAKELAARNITVNAVAPGFIVSAMTDKLPEDVKAKMQEMIPLNRWGTADDVANIVLFYTSPLASYTTGHVLNVDGGMVM
ncbi:MAG TPA: 3-oxoacyl-[acyl-carrier-protein] reductase [Armatimonadota bacterium]|nr:3-oxoacyl-[acyl-carrier-protein] reductase [Armatimonadota bacterium]